MGSMNLSLKIEGFVLTHRSRANTKHCYIQRLKCSLWYSHTSPKIDPKEHWNFNPSMYEYVFKLNLINSLNSFPYLNHIAPAGSIFSMENIF